MRFLEIDEEGNVNSATRVPLHPVRAKIRLAIHSWEKKRYLWIANFTWYIHVGSLISTLPASADKRGSYFTKCRRFFLFFFFFINLIIPLVRSSSFHNEIFVSLLKFIYAHLNTSF